MLMYRRVCPRITTSNKLKKNVAIRTHDSRNVFRQCTFEEPQRTVYGVYGDKAKYL